jgi:hypothetical protein
MDVNNKIFGVDLSTRRMTMIADINTSRGLLKVPEEPAVLGATAEGQLRVFWRQGPGLWCFNVLGDRADTKENLRSIWEEVV